MMFRSGLSLGETRSLLALEQASTASPGVLIQRLFFEFQSWKLNA